MNYIDFPLPIINILNRLEIWSQEQLISFKREDATNKGFKWISELENNFEFVFYFQKSSPDATKYTFGVLGNPKDLINYDSDFHEVLGDFNHPYNIEIEESIIEVLDVRFNEWINTVQTFEGSSLFGNLSYTYYQKEFFDNFEIVGEDVDKVPFDLDRQILLDGLVSKTLDIIRINNDEQNSLKYLIEEGESIKESITTSTKKSLIHMLSKWYSKIRSLGPTLATEILKFFTIEGVKFLTGI